MKCRFGMDMWLRSEGDEINLDIDIDIIETSPNSDLNKETTKLKKRFDCVEIGCPNNNGFGYSTFNNLQVHRRDKHSIVLRPKMSNKKDVFSDQSELFVQSFLSSKELGLSESQSLAMLKNIFTGKVVNDVKQELIDYKSKCQRSIDSQKGVVEKLNCPNVPEMMNLLSLVRESKNLDDLDVFIECLLEERKLRGLKLDAKLSKGKALLSLLTKDDTTPDNSYVNNELSTSASSASASSASSTPGATFIERVSDSLLGKRKEA